MTPTRYQSGETDYSGQISKNGDDSVRAVLYEAAHVISTRPLKSCTALNGWSMRIAKRALTWCGHVLEIAASDFTLAAGHPLSPISLRTGRIGSSS
jgi:transposase